MSTPFDTALRVQNRAVETIRIAISLEIARQTEIEKAQHELVDRMRRENAIAVQAALPGSGAWLHHMLVNRHKLRADARGTETRLAALRAEAAEAYGAMRAIEGAAERHRDETEREGNATEQARLDDFGAARLMRTRRTKVQGRIA